MLHVAEQESESLARCISVAIDEYGPPSPDEPWRLIWYYDEICTSPLANHDAKNTLGAIGALWSLVRNCSLTKTSGLSLPQFGQISYRVSLVEYLTS